jgi:hypothetical protein
MTLLRQIFLVASCLTAPYAIAQTWESESPGGRGGQQLVRELQQAVANQQLRIDALQKELRLRDRQFEEMKQMLQEMRALHLQGVAGTKVEATAGASTADLSAPAGPAATLVSVNPPIPVSQGRPAQDLAAAPQEKKAEPAKWYEKIHLRGYTQLRYERVVDSEHGSLSNTDGFTIRRARLVFSGDLNNRVSLYFQPDFASSNGGLNFGQIRDLYFDVYLDRDKELRIRAGQSKVPYGFEVLQSSSNRLALERAEALSSAVPNERDMGLFLYYAPSHIRQRFRYLTDSGLKGSGDYGMLAFGVYNGQTANRLDTNSGLHKVARFTYPFQIGRRQIIESSLQAFSGRYIVTDRGAATRGPASWNDARIAASLIVYPQPFGFQAEYNVGRGPEYNVRTGAIENKRLDGGYAQLMYRRRISGSQFLTAFLKSQYYDGGRKTDFDSRRHLLREHEFGAEWQINPAMELTAAFARTDRITEDSRNPANRRKGNLLRLQLQFNY